MSERIPLLDAGAARGEARAFLEQSGLTLNLFRVLAHAETSIAPQMRLGGAILSRQQLPARTRELLILLVARLSSAPYERVQHEPIARELGVSEDQLRALADLDFGAAFDGSDRAILTFGEQVVRAARVDDEVFDGVRGVLSDREIIEAVLAIGFYMTMCRVLNVAQTEPDADHELGLKIFRSIRPRGEHGD